ncbi:MAG: IS5/IS1182 family transposase, partial [Gammaproteobacteria bacterium]|nr:IS5/IS1182 family transposase [Gammaproteobacteria bacterium]
ISDFRKNNIKEIEKYFVDIVRIFSELGYKNVGKIYLDGTKIKGNASSKRTKGSADFEKWLERIDEEIKNLLKEAEAIDNQEDESCKLSSEQEELRKKLSNRKYVKNKIHDALEMLKDEQRKKINLTDQDANFMKAGGSKDIRPGYNCQAVSTGDGIIVAADSVTGANDHDQLEPMIE